ncbi:MAG: hypothetical protein H7067_19440 [Burkholderiales bacterium]|nr:hypothetical protein [Opitutaceae bacterium]
MFLRLLLALLAFAPLLAANPPPGPSPHPVVALLKTEASSPLLEPRIEAFDALLLVELTARPEIILVEREELGGVLDELHLQAQAATSATNAVQIGRWTGARIIVSARATARGPGLSVAARILGTETGAVLVTDITMDAPYQFAAGAGSLAAKIATLIAEKGAALLPPPDDEAAQLAALRAALGGQTPRSIQLSIQESRGAAPVAPVIHSLAAEEIARIWEAAGGRASRDPESTSPSDSLLLRAEARAELGLRPGQFVSARGHISLVVIDSASGREIFRDRQTEIVLETSDALALDAALQKSARLLTLRLLRAFSPPVRS